MNKHIHTSINEYFSKDTIKVYHGTKPKFVEEIKKNGLIDKTEVYSPGWYMLSTDFESALFHAHPDMEGGDVFVIEFEIPNLVNEMWDGYPYLWKGEIRNDKSIWFALKEPLPNKFIKDIIKVDYDKWIKRKDLKF